MQIQRNVQRIFCRAVYHNVQCIVQWSVLRRGLAMHVHADIYVHILRQSAQGNTQRILMSNYDTITQLDTENASIL